jgi:hypothetical protein
VSLVVSADGSVLYGLGGTAATGSVRSGGVGPNSTGIWLFDAETLSVIDHWEPVTAYSAIGLADEGRFVVALGLPGGDAQGMPARWPTSLVAVDAVTGELGALYGDVGSVDTVLLEVVREARVAARRGRGPGPPRWRHDVDAQ